MRMPSFATLRLAAPRPGFGDLASGGAGQPDFPPGAGGREEHDRRELGPPAGGQPVPTASTVTGSCCGTLQSSDAADGRFTDVHHHVHGHHAPAQQRRRLALTAASAPV
jgi:hypothetical protein